MKKIMYKSKAIQAVIVLTAAVLLCTLWPVRLWRETVVSSVGVETGTVTGAITDDITVMQTFYAQYGHLDSLCLYFGEDCLGESCYVRILDPKWQQVCEEKVVLDMDALPGYVDVPIDIATEVNEMYYIILQGNASIVYTGCEEVSHEEMPWLGNLYYNDSEIEGYSLAAEYRYGVPLRKTKIAAYGAGILAAAWLLCTINRLYFKKREDRLVTVEAVCKTVFNPMIALAALVGLFVVFTGKWGHYTLDNSVYVISILLLAALLFYGVNHNRTGQEAVLTAAYWKTHGRDLLQSLCLAGAIGACCEYMAGLYDIHHAVAERKEMIWFALAVLAMLEWKELLNLTNAVYMLAACACGYYYFQTVRMEEMDELQLLVLKLTVWVAILLGLVILRTVLGLLHKKLAKPSYLYAALMLLFFVILLIFRNGRWWVVALVGAFTLFYLNYGMWKEREHLLVNLARGIIFQFLYATGYCLLHRPYVTYRNARYTHIFHTVTITASYLTMVECAAVVLLLWKLRKSRKLRDYYKELVLVGVVSSYMIFTLSRTAYFAVAAAIAAALLLAAFSGGRIGWKELPANVGLLVLSVAFMLPITFTLQRNVPAYVSDPYLYDIEYSLYCPEDVMRGRHVESANFMRVGRLIQLFGDKILGIPENTWDIYGEFEQYKRTHDAEGNEIYETAALPKKIRGVEDDSGLVASLRMGAPSIVMKPEDEEPPVRDSQEDDYTNGRIDIFRAYGSQLNWTGHEEMGAMLENGEIAVHAHNIYLQAAYDHGIPVGIVFVLLGVLSFLLAVRYYFKNSETIKYAMLPAVIVTAVGVAGMVEWIYHISNPCGLLLMLAVTPLLYKENGNTENKAV